MPNELPFQAVCFINIIFKLIPVRPYFDGDACMNERLIINLVLLKNESISVLFNMFNIYSTSM